MTTDVTITVNDKRCYVKASNPDIHEFLDELLSRQIEGFKYIKKKTGWDGYYRFYFKRYKSFATGLLDYVLKGLTKAGYTNVDIIDNRTKFHITEKDIPQIYVGDKKKKEKIELRDYQLNAVKQLIKNNGGLVYIATNGGKSVIIASYVLALLNKFNFKALILVHRKELLTQLYELFSLNISEDELGVISADKIDVQGKSIVIGMVQTLNRRLKNKDDSVMFFLESINILIVDETHHAKAKTYKDIIKKAKKCLIKAGFSGTIPKPSTLEGLTVRELLGSVVIRIKNIDLINKDVSLVPKIFMLDVDSNVDLNDLEKRTKKEYYLERCERGEEDKFAGMGGVVFQRIYEAGVVYNFYQNDAIVKIVKFLEKKNLQTLVIVNRRETHGVALSEIFEKQKIDHVLWTGVTKDREKVLNEFKEKKKSVMIATSVVDEGLNIKGIDCIILASGYKSHIQLLQRLGRGLRKGSSLDYLLVVDFNHKGHKILKNHSKARYETWVNEELDVERHKNVNSLLESFDKLLKHS